MTERPLTAFEARWLAEATRLREDHSGRLDDAAANRAARSAGGDIETRICHRAARLDAQGGGLRLRLIEWTAQARWAGAALSVFALIAGLGLGASALGDGQHPVNIVWALGGLLGLHLLALGIWFAGLALPGSGDVSLAGRAWMSTTQWLGRRHGDAWLPEAGLAMARRGNTVTAWLGRISHGMWSLTLAGALVSMLVMLATRQYDFIWETTILSQDVFVELVRLLGALPAIFGVNMPDAQIVARAAAPDPMPMDRQVWSAWLVSALVLYGLLPRLALWAWCSWRWRRFTAGFRLDLDEPGYARLTTALMPASEGAEVTDADPGHLPRFVPTTAPLHAGRSSQAVALELGPDLSWPPPDWPGELVGGRLDSREQRRDTMDRLAAHPARRLLVAIDTRLSPDRGSRAMLAELSQYAAQSAVWLRADGARGDLWRETVAELGIADTHQFVDAEDARHWLEAPDE